MPTQRLILGISGADGFQYGHKALQLLQNAADIETHLVISEGAEHTCRHETAYRIEDIAVLADVVHPVRNLGAAIASGSFETAGMLVAPCSMRSLAAIARPLQEATRLGLIDPDPTLLRPTERGQRYLNDLLQLFL